MHFLLVFKPVSDQADSVLESESFELQREIEALENRARTLLSTEEHYRRKNRELKRERASLEKRLRTLQTLQAQLEAPSSATATYITYTSAAISALATIIYAFLTYSGSY
jgi:uncharacterized protein (DUF3084 family)